MDKNDNRIKVIREIYMNLDAEYKTDAKVKISNKFNVSVESINNRWIYEGKIPQGNINGVHAILKSVMSKQIRKHQKLIA